MPPDTPDHNPHDVRLYGPLVQALYRWTQPDHPRGRVDCHVVPTGPGDGERLWLHTHGADRWDLPDLEIVDVPRDVGRVAEDLVWAILNYARREGPIRAGEDFAGFLVGGRQETMHLGEFAEPSDREPPHDDMLRLVDPGGSTDDGCPHRLLATHLCATAENSPHLEERIQLFRRAIAMHPGERADDLSVDDPGAFADLQARTNIGSWEGLARTLAQKDQPDQLRTCLEQVVARAPSWAEEVKEQLLDNVGQTASPEAAQYAEFWEDFDIQRAADDTELDEAPPGGAERLDGWELQPRNAGHDGVVGLAFLVAALAATIYLLAGGEAGSGPAWTTGIVLVGLQGWCLKEELFPSNPDGPYRDELLTIAHWAARVAIAVFLVSTVV